MNAVTPYPSPIEIIRAIAVVLETKKPMAKYLDDSNRNLLAVGRVEIQYLLEKVVLNPLKNNMSPLVAEVLFQILDSYIFEYIQRIGDSSVDGCKRSIGYRQRNSLQQLRCNAKALR